MLLPINLHSWNMDYIQNRVKFGNIHHYKSAKSQRLNENWCRTCSIPATLGTGTDLSITCTQLNVLAVGVIPYEGKAHFFRCSITVVHNLVLVCCFISTGQAQLIPLFHHYRLWKPAKQAFNTSGVCLSGIEDRPYFICGIGIQTWIWCYLFPFSNLTSMWLSLRLVKVWSMCGKLQWPKRLQLKNRSYIMSRNIQYSTWQHLYHLSLICAATYW